MASRRKRLDRLVQVAIRGGDLRDETADPREEVAQVEEIKTLDRAGRKGKFEDETPPSRFQDPLDFPERFRRIGDVPDAEGEGRGVERPVRKGKRFGVGPEPFDLAPVSLVVDLLFGDLEHLGRKVDSRCGADRRSTFEEGDQLIAGPRREIEEAEIFTRRQKSGYASPPPPVHPEREDPVDPIIMGRDSIEHLPTIQTGRFNHVSHPKKE